MLTMQKHERFTTSQKEKKGKGEKLSHKDTEVVIEESSDVSDTIDTSDVLYYSASDDERHLKKFESQLVNHSVMSNDVMSRELLNGTLF